MPIGKSVRPPRGKFGFGGGHRHQEVFLNGGAILIFFTQPPRYFQGKAANRARKTQERWAAGRYLPGFGPLRYISCLKFEPAGFWPCQIGSKGGLFPIGGAFTNVEVHFAKAGLGPVHKRLVAAFIGGLNP